MDDILQLIFDDWYYWLVFIIMCVVICQVNIVFDDIVYVLFYYVNLFGWVWLMGMFIIFEMWLFIVNFGMVGYVFGVDLFINFEICCNQQVGEWLLFFFSGLVGCFGVLVICY